MSFLGTIMVTMGTSALLTGAVLAQALVASGSFTGAPMGDGPAGTESEHASRIETGTDRSSTAWMP